MNLKHSRRWLFSFILITFCLPYSRINAQLYPIIERDGTDTWVGTEKNLALISGNIFEYYTAAKGLPDKKINDIESDLTDIWVATPSGLVRIDRGSRSIKVYDTTNGLPGANVRAVASDDDFVWAGTNRGLALYDKVTRKWKSIQAGDGLISNRITRIIAPGKNEVFIATRQGLSVYNKRFDSWKSYTVKSGLPSDYIWEMYLDDEDMWIITDQGIARFNLRLKTFHSYTAASGLPSTKIQAFLIDGDTIWIGTDKGLVEYRSLNETIVPFVHSEGLFSNNITGLAVKDDSLWIGTDKGVCVFNKNTKAWTKYTKADRMTDDNIESLFIAGSKPVYIIERGMETYDIERDEYKLYPYPKPSDSIATKDELRLNFRFETLSNTEETFTFYKDRADSHQGFSTLDTKLGFGAQFPEGRSFDTSFRFDYGDLHTTGVKEYNYDVRYLGKEDDIVKEIAGSDLYLLKPERENIIERIGLEGGKIRLKTPEGKIKTEAAAGVRRGVYFKEFFQGDIESIYQLAKKYIIPQTETVKVDGQILERNIDYAIIYTTGYLAFLDEFKTNALSLIEISYEYDLKAKKKLGVLSIIDLLPFDDEVSGFKRSGSYNYAKDETALYAQIDGAAPRYLNRGWEESLFQDYQSGSSSVRIQINDMGSEVNAAEIFSFDRPVSATDLSDDMVLNEGLSDGYEIKMKMEEHYIELSIDQKTEAAKQLIILFALVISEKDTAQGGTIDDLREIIASVRTAYAPRENSEIGLNYIFTKSVNNPNLALPSRSLHLGGIDSYNDFDISEETKLSTGAALFGNRAENSSEGSTQSFGARANMRLNNPYVIARLDGGYEGENFQRIGTRQTYFGNLRDNVELSGTVYPYKWLPIDLFSGREESYLDDPTLSGYGTSNQYASRISLERENLPNLSFGASFSDLDSPLETQNKMRFTGDFEYDFAKVVLRPLKFKKFFLKAFYDYTDLNTAESGSHTTNHINNARYELKVAPTLTETGYAIYKDRYLKERSSPDPALKDVLRIQEFTIGGLSTYLPGFVPSVSEQLTYTDDFREETLGKKDVKANLTTGIDLFPGQWFSVLKEVSFSNKYSYITEERAIGTIKTGRDITHKLDITGNYDSYRYFTATVQGIFTYKKTGQTLETLENRKDLLSEFIIRPIYEMPITLLFNMARVSQPIDLTNSISSEYHPAIRWEMKWTRNFTTRVGFNFDILKASNFFDADTASFLSYDQHSETPFTEIRHTIQDLFGGTLQSFYKLSYQVTSGSGTGSSSFKELFISGGWIYSFSNNVYADLTVDFTKHDCEAGSVSCESFMILEPKMIATVKF